MRIFIVDLSTSGARAMTRNELKPGDSFSMELNLGGLVTSNDGQLRRTGEIVTLMGEVVWHRSSENLKRSFAIGCRFYPPGPEMTEKLDRFITSRIEAGDQQVGEFLDSAAEQSDGGGFTAEPDDPIEFDDADDEDHR